MRRYGPAACRNSCWIVCCARFENVWTSRAPPTRKASGWRQPLGALGSGQQIRATVTVAGHRLVRDARPGVLVRGRRAGEPAPDPCGDRRAPGRVAGEVASATGIARATVASTLGKLARDGELERADLPGGRVGFRRARQQPEPAGQSTTPISAPNVDAAPTVSEDAASEALPTG